jgi:hypothetical protein
MSKSTNMKWSYSEEIKSSLKNKKGSRNRKKEECRRNENARN